METQELSGCTIKSVAKGDIKALGHNALQPNGKNQGQWEMKGKERRDRERKRERGEERERNALRETQRRQHDTIPTFSRIFIMLIHLAPPPPKKKMQVSPSGWTIG